MSNEKSLECGERMKSEIENFLIRGKRKNSLSQEISDGEFNLGSIDKGNSQHVKSFYSMQRYF